MLGKKLKELTHLTGGLYEGVLPVKQVCVKVACLPLQ